MSEVSSDDRTQAMLGHLSLILLGVLGPLIFWLINKDKGGYVKEQNTEALNFGILGAIATIVTCGIAQLAVIVFAIIAGLAANKGENYRYPLNWRLVK